MNKHKGSAFEPHFQDSVDEMLDRLNKLEKVAEALLSVLSEEGVKEYLSAYVMGVELIDRAKDLDAGENGT